MNIDMIKASSYKKTHPALSLVAVLQAIVFVSGCSLSRHAISALRSTDHFIQSQDDPRVLFEPGAEDYATNVLSPKYDVYTLTGYHA